MKKHKMPACSWCHAPLLPGGHAEHIPGYGHVHAMCAQAVRSSDPNYVEPQVTTPKKRPEEWAREIKDVLTAASDDGTEAYFDNTCCSCSSGIMLRVGPPTGDVENDPIVWGSPK